VHSSQLSYTPDVRGIISEAEGRFNRRSSSVMRQASILLGLGDGLALGLHLLLAFGLDLSGLLLRGRLFDVVVVVIILVLVLIVVVTLVTILEALLEADDG